MFLFFYKLCIISTEGNFLKNCQITINEYLVNGIKSLPTSCMKNIYNISLLLICFTSTYAMEELKSSNSPSHSLQETLKQVEARRNGLLNYIVSLDGERSPQILDSFDISKEYYWVNNLADMKEILKASPSGEKENYLSELSRDFYQLARLLMVKGLEKETHEVFEGFVSCYQYAFPTKANYRVQAEDLWQGVVDDNLEKIRREIVGLLENNDLKVAEEKADYVIQNIWMSVSEQKSDSQMDWFKSVSRGIKSSKKYTNISEPIQFVTCHMQLHESFINLKNTISSTRNMPSTLAAYSILSSHNDLAKTLLEMVTCNKEKRKLLFELANHYCMLAYYFGDNKEEASKIFQSWSLLCNLAHKDDQQASSNVDIIAAKIWDATIQERLKHMRKQTKEDLKDAKKITNVDKTLQDCLKHTRLRTSYSSESNQRTVEWVRIMKSHLVYARTFHSCSDFYQFIGSLFEINSYYRNIKKIPKKRRINRPELFEQLKHHFGKHLSLLDDETEREQSMRVLYMRFPEIQEFFRLGRQAGMKKRCVDLTLDDSIHLIEDQEKEASHGHMEITGKQRDEKSHTHTEDSTLKRKLPTDFSKKTEAEKKKSAYSLLN